jgi:hypothetical protein
MKINKKKGIEKISIEFNKPLLIIIIILFIILLIIVGLILRTNNKKDNIISCEIDSDCVPSTCCHPENCVNKKYIPICEKIPCTLECSSILDCGQGECHCQDNKCIAKKI